MQVYFQSQYDFRKDKERTRSIQKSSSMLRVGEPPTLNKARHQRFNSRG